MQFTKTQLADAMLIVPEPIEDERGFFARVWCRDEFARHGLHAQFAQCNISYNRFRGVLRGLHYQAPPHEETKLVRCTRGAVYDVIADLRPGSPTYLQWQAFQLTAENRHLLYIPAGFAHGFQTLEDDSELFYQMDVACHSEYARGLRWDDPCLDIRWPMPPRVISPRDRAFPDFQPQEDGATTLGG